MITKSKTNETNPRMVKNIKRAVTYCLNKVMMNILSHMLNLKNKDKEETPSDNIKDAHYSKSAIEPLEYMALAFTRDEFIGFIKGNILKYSLRAPYKNQEEDDRRKAKFYTELLRELAAYPTMTNITSYRLFKKKQESKE